MALDIMWIVVGLVLILVGANALTDGSSSIASRMGVSELVIGLTVVAIGTSAPELVVSLMAAINGNAPLAVGNVVGSNIMNILIIIGVTAMVRPIVVERTVMTIEIPIVILTSLVLLVLGNCVLLDGTPNVVSRTSGIFLLVACALYMRHTLLSAKSAPAAEVGESEVKQMPVLKAIVYIIVGLGALVWGGDRFVDGASGLARALGLSDAVIGLTIVAGGTSLPELATAVVAALKGRPGLAVGNVIGSNILNVFFVLGLAATVSPLPFGDVGNLDLLTNVVASLLFLTFGWFFKTRTITRAEGAVLVACYVAYVCIVLH